MSICFQIKHLPMVWQFPAGFFAILSKTQPVILQVEKPVMTGETAC
jgi:hypothetical protein